ncbi:YcaO-like family protein [Vibrio aerogenes CECT 7868]|uniref:YcaO-like family protein n=1 Tax=Vibrio aerogenes CECT 7868 TaxID=1216006 RepID=A0A1M5Y1E0_9VIBR|nr:YcaO-like family protein [Vibrio aerogenes]SHI05759.1 YcaO-like family protein [Vibrio aerogenes CECT 7868]
MTRKTYQRGTHRACSPQATYEKIAPWLLDMGITRVANITGLDRIGVPVVTVCRPDSCAISVAQGKGLDLISAKVSGIMEAIESYHGEHIDLPLRRASYHELRQKQAVVDVDTLPKLAFSQFSEHARILWVEGQDLQTSQPLYVPYEIVHCDYTLPLPTGSGALVMSTNGLASGNTVEEAIVHGLCEVIERDALTLWAIEQQWLADRQKTSAMHTRRLDPASVDDIACRQVLDQLFQAEMQVQVWDIRADTGLPTFFCRIAPGDSRDTKNHLRPGPAFSSSGSGTHPCKGIALLRALTEAAQTRLTMISGSRDDIEANDYRHGEPEYLPDSPIDGCCSFTDIPSWSLGSFEDDIALILDKLNQIGIPQTAVINLEKAPYHIPVVRVVVPGLEGIHGTPGYVMGKRAIAYRNTLESSRNQGHMVTGDEHR